MAAVVLREERLSEQARSLVAVSARTILEASMIADPSVRYITAHLGALRAAAAVLAARAIPDSGRGRRSRIRNTWELLPKVAPELGEWAGLFAASAAVRVAAEAGRGVTDALADEVVHKAQEFLSVVCHVLNVPVAHPLQLSENASA